MAGSRELRSKRILLPKMPRCSDRWYYLRKSQTVGEAFVFSKHRLQCVRGKVEVKTEDWSGEATYSCDVVEFTVPNPGLSQ
jgi:hypothetical protein